MNKGIRFFKKKLHVFIKQLANLIQWATNKTI